MFTSKREKGFIFVCGMVAGTSVNILETADAGKKTKNIQFGERKCFVNERSKEIKEE